jgi:hypothetical protein
MGANAARRAVRAQRPPRTILPGRKGMFESISMSVIAVTAGACLTFIIAILLPEPVAAKGSRGGLYAGLGDADESFAPANQARMRRLRALLTWRAGGPSPRYLADVPARPVNRRRVRSVCPARAR